MSNLHAEQALDTLLDELNLAAEYAGIPEEIKFGSELYPDGTTEITVVGDGPARYYAVDTTAAMKNLVDLPDDTTLAAICDALTRAKPAPETTP